jgi:hypothetical protein
MPSQKTIITQAAQKHSIRPDILSDLYGAPADLESARPPAQVHDQLKARVPPAMRLGQELALLVASGKVRSASTFRADVRKRIVAVEDVIAHPEHYEGGASPGHAESARENLGLLQGAEHPHVLHNARRIVNNGIRYARELNKGDRQLKGVAIHPRAALSEYALVHMGAHPLTDDAIKAHAARSGRAPDTLAHVPHAVDAVHKHVSHRPLPRIAKKA